MFYLMVQELEQVEIPPSQRSTFAGTEQSFRSFFELCHWGATIVWSRPQEFRWLALGNLIVLSIGTAIYALWQRKEVMSEGRVGYEEIALEDVDRIEVEHED
jgi:iron-regulated transporter 1